MIPALSYRPPADTSMASAAEWLENPFRPQREDLVSFLVNGLYLIGKHRILEWEPSDGLAAAELEARGHRVIARGAEPAEAAAAGAFDRAMLLSRAFGYPGDGIDGSWLKAMHKALRPGGLLLFHVLDRDRAWSMVRQDSGQAPAWTPVDAGGAPARKPQIGFDPFSGMVTAKLLISGGFPPGKVFRRERSLSVRAFNLAEIRGLLAKAGFALERAYGDWQAGGLEEAGERTGRILVVASKLRRGRGSRIRRAGIIGSGKGGAA